MKRPHSYLHLHRRKQCLNQKELAYLLGRKNASFISRFEHRKRHPDLEAAFACQVLFGILPSELFPKLFADVEDSVIRRAYKLHERLSQHRAPTTKAKLKLLKGILARAKDRHTEKEA
ncbi:helix-turn-helix domain-containing protein [Oligoflexia bacterium]|nr:helix-turn-helix domain-containing protein [Oligoflexia bacterium]